MIDELSEKKVAHVSDFQKPADSKNVNLTLAAVSSMRKLLITTPSSFGRWVVVLRLCSQKII